MGVGILFPDNARRLLRSAILNAGAAVDLYRSTLCSVVDRGYGYFPDIVTQLGTRRCNGFFNPVVLGGGIILPFHLHCSSAVGTSGDSGRTSTRSLTLNRTACILIHRELSSWKTCSLSIGLFEANPTSLGINILICHTNQNWLAARMSTVWLVEGIGGGGLPFDVELSALPVIPDLLKQHKTGFLSLCPFWVICSQRGLTLCYQRVNLFLPYRIRPCHIRGNPCQAPLQVKPQSNLCIRVVEKLLPLVNPLLLAVKVHIQQPGNRLHFIRTFYPIKGIFGAGSGRPLFAVATEACILLTCSILHAEKLKVGLLRAPVRRPVVYPSCLSCKGDVLGYSARICRIGRGKYSGWNQAQHHNKYQEQ